METVAPHHGRRRGWVVLPGTGEPSPYHPCPLTGFRVSNIRALDLSREGAPAFGRVDTGSGFGRVACG
jgi:hypothetical protein